MPLLKHVIKARFSLAPVLSPGIPRSPVGNRVTEECLHRDKGASAFPFLSAIPQVVNKPESEIACALPILGSLPRELSFTTQAGMVSRPNHSHRSAMNLDGRTGMLDRLLYLLQRSVNALGEVTSLRPQRPLPLRSLLAPNYPEFGTCEAVRVQFPSITPLGPIS